MLFSALVILLCLFLISSLTTFLLDDLQNKSPINHPAWPVRAVDAQRAARYFIREEGITY